MVDYCKHCNALCGDNELCPSCAFDLEDLQNIDFNEEEENWNNNFYPAWDKEEIQIDCDGNDIIY